MRAQLAAENPGSSGQPPSPAAGFGFAPSPAAGAGGVPPRELPLGGSLGMSARVTQDGHMRLRMTRGATRLPEGTAQEAPQQVAPPPERME
eukprot:6210671-Pyramimonas_sp.AAC.1